MLKKIIIDQRDRRRLPRYCPGLRPPQRRPASLSPADVPPGKHQFWIELKDNDGRIGGTEFSFQVVK